MDQAIAGKFKKSALPIWHGYPWRKITHPKTWTAFTAAAIREHGKALIETVPFDIGWHCPKYPQMNEEQRVGFWIRLISVLGESESSMNPLLVHRDTPVGPNIFSTGLLQISLVSAQQAKWGCTMIQKQDDLFEWRKNITCAVKIMNQLMIEDKALSYSTNLPSKQTWYGLSRYWGPFRDSRIKVPEKRVCINEVVEQRRPDWIKDSKSDRHPSNTTSEYKAAGEKNFEKIMRFLNYFPYCN